MPLNPELCLDHVDIYYCVNEFYALQFVDAEKQIDPFKRSHERWLYDFEAYKSAFEEKFAFMLHDYIVLACFGEARHAGNPNYCKAYIEEVPYCKKRDDAYEYALSYNPVSILKTCYELFSAEWYDEAFGGKSWAKITRAGLMFYNNAIPKSTFIDHCVDLSHNGGMAFNKRETRIFYCVQPHIYKDFLTYKAHIKNFSDYLSYPCLFNNPNYSCSRTCKERFDTCSNKAIVICISSRLITLLERANNLGIVQVDIEKARKNLAKSHFSALRTDHMINGVMTYQPIEFGDKALGGVVYHCIDDNEFEDSDKDYYEKEEYEENEDLEYEIEVVPERAKDNAIDDATENAGNQEAGAA